MTITQANAVNAIARFLLGSGGLDLDDVDALLGPAYKALKSGLTPVAFRQAHAALGVRHVCRKCKTDVTICTCPRVGTCARCGRIYTSASQFTRDAGRTVCKANTLCGEAAFMGAWR